MKGDDEGDEVLSPQSTELVFDDPVTLTNGRCQLLAIQDLYMSANVTNRIGEGRIIKLSTTAIP